jgi:prolyl-tRNA editing enzyme YbaK/EbsC (Cys-tRNA(Pro) deacylase)
MSDDAEIEAKVAAALERLGATWELMRIDPDFADTAAFCEKYGVPLDHSGNTIIVASKKEPKKFCACLVLATTRLDVNHAVRRLMDVSRVSFATADETMELTGMMIGGVTLLALPPDLPVYVDGRVMALDYVILGGGSRSSKLKVGPGVLLSVPNLTVVPGLATAVS